MVYIHIIFSETKFTYILFKIFIHTIVKAVSRIIWI
jgi:hypothetical protein